jgi:hypothetical protein
MRHSGWSSDSFRVQWWLPIGFLVEMHMWAVRGTMHVRCAPNHASATESEHELSRVRVECTSPRCIGHGLFLRCRLLLARN